MLPVTAHKAKTHLPRLIDDAANGTEPEIIIAETGNYAKGDESEQGCFSVEHFFTVSNNLHYLISWGKFVIILFHTVPILFAKFFYKEVYFEMLHLRP